MVWDFGFIVVYAAALAVICSVGARSLAARRGQKVLEVAAFLAVVAAVFDIAENANLLVGLPTETQTMTQAGSDGWFSAAQGMAVGKFVAVMLPVGCGLFVVAVVFWRAAGWPLRGGQPVQPDRAVEVQARPITDSHSSWESNYTVPAVQNVGRAGGGTGLCLSGGGIRSGIFAMGALQLLAQHKVLHRTRLLATVSGGGYFGSAYQTLRHMLWSCRERGAGGAAGGR